MDSRLIRERKSQEILLHYIDGKVLDPEHDTDDVEELYLAGYLSWKMTDDYRNYYKTTDTGLIYLRSRGYDVSAPDVRNNRIVGIDKCDRLVDWSPSVPKCPDQDGGMSVSRSGSGWFKRSRRTATRAERNRGLSCRDSTVSDPSSH